MMPIFGAVLEIVLDGRRLAVGAGLVLLDRGELALEAPELAAGFADRVGRVDVVAAELLELLTQ